MLDKITIATIQQYAAASEQLQSLHPALLELAWKQGWFKLFVPEIYGGPGKTLPEILRLEEAIAAEDGSLGWTVTLCSGAGWFAGFLDPALAHTLFANPKVCFAGSGEVGGTATRYTDHYLVNGTWHYASGASHATVFTANCTLLLPDGSPVLDTAGQPEVVSFILLPEEVNIIPGWSYTGMVATGSHAFEAVGQQVPLNRTFRINEEIQVNSPGFDYPFLQLAETTLAVNSAGMGLHFLQLVDAAFRKRSGQKKYKPEQVLQFEELLENSIRALDNARTGFYTAFDTSWHTLQSKQSIPEWELQQVSKASRQLAHTAREVCDKLYPYCGLEAARKETEINRVWRDIHTASQHALLTFI
ncbi:MAG: acyl-CoA dehydrogenase [Chitinophaga sp.]|uniref:acyl-CoA dehydrogenase n=1 Tax=Chitinophaga sp. TaxID=1869181 RepID=UPI001AFDDDFC|nr:acyl-CoA dehydrogenase [Chitinophaga sp.]MBO9729897.1 acyl-CoA dehydrogenase [Chitinophaga sp.]